MPEDSDIACYTHKEAVTLRDHMDAKLGALEKLVMTQLMAIDKATALALSTQSNRFDTTNEWRKTVDDILKTAVLRSTYEPEILRLKADITELKRANAERAGIPERMQGLSDSVEDLKLSRANLAGKAEQSSVYWVGALGVIGVLLSIAGLIVK